MIAYRLLKPFHSLGGVTLSFPARRFRSLSPTDALRRSSVFALGTQLQLLAAHGDQEWLESLADFVNARVRNVLEMEATHRRRDD